MPSQVGLETGAVFAGHRIESKIGQGGMGVVYRARHLVLNRDVALKVIAPHLAEDAGFVGRFKKESIVAAGIDHPNVIPIYHAGEQDGVYFITMRLIEGTDLRAFLTSRGALAPDLALKVLVPVAAALDAAHEHALVHRDVKPGNVLIGAPPDEARHVYLTDFGLTKRTISGGGLTKTGQVVGTFDYVAPEQIEGGEVDRRTDIYSLACVLYEMLSGEVPYPLAEDAAKLWAHMQREPPVLTAHRPALPAPLDDVIRRGMAKNRDDRYPSAGALAGAAVEVIRGSAPEPASVSASTKPAVASPPPAPPPRAAPPPSPAPPPPGAPPPQPVVRRTRTRRPAALVGGALGALAIGVVGLVLAIGGGSSSATKSIKVGVRPSDIAVDHGSAWVANNGDGTVSRIDLGSHRVADPPIAVGASPEQVAVGGGRVWVERSGSTPARASVLRIDPATGRRDRGPFQLHSDGFGIAVGHGAVWVADGRSSVLRVDADSGRVKAIHAGPAPRDVAIGGDGAIWTVNSDNGTVVRIDPSSDRVVGSPIELEPRADALAVSGSDVWVLNPDAKTITRISSGPDHTVDPPLRMDDGPSDIAAGQGHAWVTAQDAQKLLRFRAGSGTGSPRHLDEAPGAVAFGGGAVWVTADTANRVLRIDPKAFD
ncbi:MAG: protein kinase domain-containing protein [Thermoleophilaceae bacterium]